MAHVFQIVYGSTTITLAPLSGYQMVTPKDGDTEVTERMPILVSAASVSLLQTAFQALNLAANQAASRRITGRGDRVYLVATPDGYGASYRSEIYSLIVPPSDRTLDYEWVNLKLEIELGIVRAPWWEASSETQISLTNTNGTDNTAGLNVYNCNDGSGSSPNNRVNYVEITAAKVAGDLPAPVRLEMYDFCPNSGDQLTDIWVSHNWRSDPANFVHLYDLSGSVDANMSGGQNQRISYSANAAYAYATLAAAQIARMHGRNYRILARLAASTYMPTTIFRPGVDFLSTSLSLVSLYGNPVYGSSLTKYSGSSAFPLIDIGMTRAIPSFEIPGLAFGDGAIGFVAENTTASTIDVDYIYLLPVDGFRRIEASGGVNSDYVLNELENTCYRLNASGYYYGSDKMEGTPILLQPNTLQRLYFAWNYIPVTPGTYTDAVITDYITVKLYYRPRRRTL